MEAVSKIQKIFKIEESASTGISYLIKVLFYLLGFKFIWSKMVPVSTKEEKEDNYRKPPTLFLWLIAIHTATFGFTSQRYESNLDKVEYKAGLLVTQLSSTEFKVGSPRIGYIQNLKECSTKPEFLIFLHILLCGVKKLFVKM